MVSVLLLALVFGFATALMEKPAVQGGAFSLMALMAVIYHEATPGLPSLMVVMATAGFFYVFGSSMAGMVQVLVRIPRA